MRFEFLHARVSLELAQTEAIDAAIPHLGVDSCQNLNVQATVDLSESVLESLEQLAAKEGTEPADLIRRYVEEGIQRAEPNPREKFRVKLPIFPASGREVIQPITGAEMDELFAREDFAS